MTIGAVISIRHLMTVGAAIAIRHLMTIGAAIATRHLMTVGAAIATRHLMTVGAAVVGKGQRFVRFSAFCRSDSAGNLKTRDTFCWIILILIMGNRTANED
jgi:hypothetical protein